MKKLFIILMLALVGLASSCNSNSYECTQARMHEHHYKLGGVAKKVLAEQDLLVKFMQSDCLHKNEMFYKYVWDTERTAELMDEHIERMAGRRNRTNQ